MNISEFCCIKLVVNLKEKRNIGRQCEAMTSHVLTSNSLLVENVPTSIANISIIEHGKWMKNLRECLEYVPRLTYQT